MRRKDPPPIDSLFDVTHSGSAVELFQSPDQQAFPLNTRRQRVRDLVISDLRSSKSPLILTGYASLDQIIEFVSRAPETPKIRVVFGNEPFRVERKSYRIGAGKLPDEVREYWLRKGISPTLSAQVIACMERLKTRALEARYLGWGDRQLHAKIYVGDSAATVGSSNFTRAGLERQIEANARFQRSQEHKRYDQLKTIADAYWDAASAYTDELLELLQSMLRVVQWQEALARACAELLEGDWANKFIDANSMGHSSPLWPSQRQGIAQALYILSRQGSVLIADTTGSGKTRLGTHLLHAVISQIISSSRARVVNPLMICPPAVEEIWRQEATTINVPLATVSHGVLSHQRSREHDRMLERLRQAQVLCVDEGHNFLNSKANRTQSLLRNMADHVMVFTATPINRSTNDLIPIVDLLGADNLEPATVEAFRKIFSTTTLNRPLTPAEVESLRTEIQKFTVRRTKPILNSLIDQDPDAYRDQNGRPCRFPMHLAKVYSLNETDRDRDLAIEIRALADGLIGVAGFRKPLALPDVLRQQGWTEEKYLESRLSTSKRLARYLIMALLRSSRAALGEHIVGTDQVCRDLSLQFRKGTRTGNMLEDLDLIAGKVPTNYLSVPVPDWLVDPAAHRSACEHDRSIYANIYERLRQMSGARERAKATKLVELNHRHRLVLAFDRSPITLAEIRRQIAEISPPTLVLIASGEASSDRRRLLKEFQGGSGASARIGLCSDSLAEGVNLQEASCLLHLDMPSVVRIAEQRAGRVDRMDSPHDEIECWWPQDAPEFALSSDDKFLERYETVDRLLGSNLPLPDALREREPNPTTTQEMIRQYEDSADAALWDGIHDSFEPVRNLVEGPEALIDQQTYADLRAVSAQVLAKVSVIRSASAWAFFCLRSGSFGAPKWILFPDRNAPPITDLTAVCSSLRERLSAGVENAQMDASAAQELERFATRLKDVLKDTLPRKKRRALEQMQTVLQSFRARASQDQEFERFEAYNSILDVLNARKADGQPDWDDLASRWLEVIRPVWYQRLAERRRKPLTLRDIQDDLKSREEELFPRITKVFLDAELPFPEEQIAAAIIALPG